MEKLIKTYEKTAYVYCDFEEMYKSCEDLFYSLYDEEDEITIDYCLENIFFEEVGYFDDRDYEVMELFDMYEDIRDDFEKYLQKRGLIYNKDLV